MRYELSVMSKKGDHVEKQYVSYKINLTNRIRFIDIITYVYSLLFLVSLYILHIFFFFFAIRFMEYFNIIREKLVNVVIVFVVLMCCPI